MFILLKYALKLLMLSNLSIDNQNIYRASEIKLHQDLFKNYNRNVSPMENIENSTSVVVAYHFNSLKEFDDRTGHISISGVGMLRNIMEFI